MKKVILITGASSGIGEATAQKLLDDGHTVYAAARRVNKMKHLKEKGAHILALDVTDDESVRECVDTVIKQESRIDILFNNAGFGQYGTVEETPIEKAKYQFDVNLFGLARVTQLVIPHMRRQESGTIINTSSMGGKMYTPLGAWYHASKHALEGWSDCLRLELKQFNIRVAIVEPGIIDTNFYEVLQQTVPDTSRKGPYKEFVAGVEKSSQESLPSSPPSVIADVVSKIVGSKNPKTRYVAGKMARLLMFIRKWMGDKIFDRVIMSRIG